jgi:hypothetical protein
MTKDGMSNNRELTNARAKLDHWRASVENRPQSHTPTFATAWGR